MRAQASRSSAMDPEVRARALVERRPGFFLQGLGVLVSAVRAEEFRAGEAVGLRRYLRMGLH